MNIRERKPRQKKPNSALQHLRLSTDFWSVMREELLNALSFVCIHRDVFLEYDKVIEIYASRYPWRMLLTIPLSE